ncbi:unnamed protein product [Porites lobata]|uniref:SMCHD1 Ig-like domain-containing protein n=1 Tax=Porites lobata TaxID=104759 RepID=A0ABN8SD98_9CNID|nr:unnamed protein product [Porites lobata]
MLLSDSSTAPSIKSLPVHRIEFTVTEAHPNKFTVGMLETPLRVGVPFQLTHQGTSVKGNSLIVKGVVALGSVPSHAGKITLPGLEEGSQSLKIRLLPGPPESLAVTPNDSEVTIENNSALQLQVQVQDKAGNLTVQPSLNVVCKFTIGDKIVETLSSNGITSKNKTIRTPPPSRPLKLTGTPGLPTYIGDCSASGKASLTGADISLKQITKETKLKAKIELQVCHLIREMGMVPSWVFMSCFGAITLGAMPPFVVLSEKEKRRFCLNHVIPLKSLKPEYLDQSSNWFSKCERPFID